MVSHDSDFGATSPNETDAVTPQNPAPLPTRRSLREAESAKTAKPASAPTATSSAQVDRPVEAAPAARRAKPVGPKPASKPRNTSPKPKANGRIRRTGSIVTMVAMAFIAGLAVATSLPANALLTKEQVYDLANGQRQDAGYLDSQEIQATDSVSASGRDGVVAMQWGGVIGGGLYSGETYRNNPLGKIQWPLHQTFPISDVFGLRHNPWGSGFEYHQGVDFNPPAGYPIQAIADGVVEIAGASASGNYGALGVYVQIDHGIINGHHIQSIYAHMTDGSVQVKVGQRVHVADVLGQVGCTGSCTGAHLHLAMMIDGKISDPLSWLRANAK